MTHRSPSVATDSFGVVASLAGPGESTAEERPGGVIYTLTVIEKTPGSHTAVRDHRTWLWVASLEQAERLMVDVREWLFESGFYEYAVIEEVPEGFGIARAKAWYRASVSEDGESVSVDKSVAPEWADRIVNWGMG
jgi:hypothetical protein